MRIAIKNISIKTQYIIVIKVDGIWISKIISNLVAPSFSTVN